MCDALSRNSPKLIETLLGNSLAHGRHQFTEVAESFHPLKYSAMFHPPEIDTMPLVKVPVRPSSPRRTIAFSHRRMSLNGTDEGR